MKSTPVRAVEGINWDSGARTQLAHAPRLLRRRPAITVFVAAIVTRGVAAAVIVRLHPYLFPDERGYVTLGHLAAVGRLNSTVDSGFGEYLFHEAASFMWPVEILFRLFGSHVIIAALWSALFGAVTASGVAWMLARVLTAGWGVIGGLTVALFPSQVLWSSVVLRESMVWAGLVGLAAGILLTSYSSRWRLLLALSLLCVSLFDIAYLRGWVLIPAAWSMAAAVWFFRPVRPVLTRAACIALLVLVPMAHGDGPAGAGLVHVGASTLGTERANLARGARSSFVGSPASSSGSSLCSAVAPVALSNEGCLVNNGFKADVKAFPRGVVAFLFRPFPGQFGNGTSYDFASAEEFLYYPLILLALLGAILYRRRRKLIAFPILVIISITCVAAEAEGNLGSAFRHRAQLEWAFSYLAVLALHALWARRQMSQLRNSHPS